MTCGACKFLRRKCVRGCLFAPYFDSENGAASFAGVHKVFGAANVSKLLLNVPAQKRLEAVVTICYEAQARLNDPVYGCVAHIYALQQQVAQLQAELAYAQTHLATMELPPPLPPPYTMPPSFSMSGIPSASNVPANFDISALFDPQMQALWSLEQQRQVAPQQQHGIGGSRGTGDLHALARELIDRHRPVNIPDSPPPSQ